MKRKIALTFILMVSLFLVFGAEECERKKTTAPGYYKCTGSKAIEARFAPDAPVSSEIDTYLPGEDIDVMVELTNKLQQDIPAGKVKLRLIGDAAIPAFFVGAKQATNPELSGVDPATCDSYPKEISLGPIKYVGEITTKISKEIKGEYCYEIPINVKANIYYTDKATEIGENLPTGSNPASSVQVVDLEQGVVKVENGVGKLNFKITIKNVGTGRLVKSLGDCFKYEKRPKEELKVEVKGAFPVSCENNGEITLSREDKSRTISCRITEIDPSILGPDPSELTITLKNFAYEDKIEPVKIWLEP